MFSLSYFHFPSFSPGWSLDAWGQETSRSREVKRAWEGCSGNPSESSAYLQCPMTSLGFSLNFQVLTGVQQPIWFRHPLLESKYAPPYLHLILKSPPLLSDPQNLSVINFSTSTPHLSLWTCPGPFHSRKELWGTQSTMAVSPTYLPLAAVSAPAWIELWAKWWHSPSGLQTPPPQYYTQ